MGYDGKYGRVTTEFGNIPPDEPVILFRSRDKHLPAVLAYYEQLCAEEGSPQRHLDLIRASQERVTTWQEHNPERVRTPDSEASRSWLGQRLSTRD